MRIWKILLASLLIVSVGAGMATAQQIPLPGNAIPQFVDPLPLLDAQTGTADDGIETLTSGTDTITMREFKSLVLPANTVPNYTGTWVWGYRAENPGASQDTYIGPVFVVPRGTPSSITWVNELPTGKPATPNVPFWWTATDQTLHWADPLGDPDPEWNDCAMSIQPGLAPVGICAQNYAGPVPAVVHLHGGEVPPQLDGGPDAWFTSDGNYQGHSYHTFGTPGGNAAIYNYPNTQEAAPAWFHDHVLGITRLNVYAGLAGGYIIWDPAITPDSISIGTTSGTCTSNCLPGDVGDVTKIIPLAIQDRMFDTTGQLFFPALAINPEHPFWVPEFVGDTILVNGKTWPYLEVTPARYRFLFLNGSNARAYQMDFKVQGKGTAPTFWVISTDGGYLDKPVPVTQLTMMPGERYGVVIDFSAFKPGTTLLLQNSAKTPFPDGAPVNRSTTGRIMEFRVTNAPAVPVAPTVTYDPNPASATYSGDLRTGGKMIERLTPVPTTPLRRLTLNEVMGPGGPLEVLVNNTKWSGESARAYGDFVPVTGGPHTTFYSELPKEGATEVWEVINLTADAHPIHLHLVQFQLLTRQAFDVRKYTAVYNAAFPGGMFRPAFGPPLNYAGGALGNPLNCSETNAVCGGNPDVTPYLLKAAAPALAQENGWKDTVIMYPGQVTRIAVRWAPQDATGTGKNYFPFDPNSGHGYVWHCHIIDHEDNEMMRPDYVQPNLPVGGIRDFSIGINY